MCLRNPVCGSILLQAAALMAVLITCAGSSGAAEFVVKESASGGAVVTVEGQPFAEYVVDQGNKPYLWPIHGPGGPLMTRSWPMKDVPGEKHDHPHQRGLTFGHQGVDGTDTWAEAASYGTGEAERAAAAKLGRIRHRGYIALAGGDTGVIHAASDVLDPAGKPILADERRFTFSRSGDARVIDVDIDLIACHGPVTLADMKDAGLSIRVPESMTVDAKQGGTIVNSAGQRDADAWAKRAVWCDYNGPVDGGRLGIAILNHPTSFRHPTPWHVRTYGLFTANPFGLKALDPASESGEIRLETGGRISLRHRFVFHRGDELEAGIAAAYEKYAGEPRPPLGGAQGSPSHADQIPAGFTSLFNGKDLEGWQGDVNGYEAVDGEIRSKKGVGGNLLTTREYADFVLRFEFRLTPGANNGLGIRAPEKGDAAFAGIELQILDDSHEKYAKIQPWQVHGSIYGVVPAARDCLEPAGEWNTQEVTVRGPRINVVVNGRQILDADITPYRDGKPTVDGKEHPGLARTTGRIGFLGHGDEVHFRRISIRELPADGR